MSEQLDDVLNSLEEEAVESIPKQLRDFAKRVEGENKQLRAENDTFKTAQRDSALNDFIKDKKLPEKAKELIGDKDPEKWYEEFGELFTAAESGETEQEDKKNETALPPDQVTQMQQVQNVETGTYQPGGSDSEMNAELENLFSGDKSEREVLAQLKAMGALA